MKQIRDLTEVVVNKVRSGEHLTATCEIDQERREPHLTKLPQWVHEFYMHFAIVYKRKWVDETDELEMATKFAWYKVLSKGLEPYGDYENVIMETIDEIAGKFAWPPSPAEFLDIALVKARSAKEKRESAQRDGEAAKLLVKVSDPEYSKRMMAQIREQMHGKGAV